MKTGTNALRRTVRYWVDVFMHAMGTETVMPIAVMNFVNDSSNALVRYISLKGIFSKVF